MGVITTDALGEFDRRATTSIAASLTRLLQENHLYQSVDLESDLLKIQSSILEATLPDERRRLDLVIQEALRAPWHLRHGYDPRAAKASSQISGPERFRLSIGADTIKVFCSRCERTEPFNSVGDLDLLNP